MLITILATAVVLGVLIFVHELGHFVTAKMVDIEVPRFSTGFGPKVFGFRRGETEYVLSLLPLGGYVKMAGMEDLEAIEGGPSEQEKAERQSRPEGDRTARSRDFESKSLPARTLVISAGVIMNLLFAFLAFSTIGLAWGVPELPEPVIGGVSEETLPEGALAFATVPRGARVTAVGEQQVSDFEQLRIALSTLRAGPVTVHFANSDPIEIEIPGTDSLRQALMLSLEPVLVAAPLLQDVVDGGPGDRAGMLAGDRIVRAAGRDIGSWQEFVAIIEARPGQPVPVVVARDGSEVELSVVPDAVSLADGHVFGRIGVARSTAGASIPKTRVGLAGALAWGASETWRWVTLTVDFLIGLFAGEHSPRSVGGPGTIAQISGQAARAGLDTFLNFMALLSVNLAVLNLLPIPVLDGGQLLFLAVEAVRGRALSLKQRMRLSQVGFVIILAIMAFAIGNDVLRWIGL
jgi:regulator of sigma E protease